MRKKSACLFFTFSFFGEFQWMIFKSVASTVVVVDEDEDDEEEDEEEE